jgi:hypothetical protein
MRLAESLRLTEKQAINALSRLSSNLDAALELLGKGLCTPGVKERFEELIRSRAGRLGLA